MKSSVKVAQNEIAGILLYICIGCFFYVLNTNVSLRNDDFVYSFIFTGEHSLFVDTNAPIRNIGDIFISQYHHYFLMNGRIPVHFLIQLFCGVLGKDVFNVCTSIVFIAFIVGTTRLIFRKQSTFFHYIGMLSVVWLFLPISVFYASGISFAINYLWSLTACVWFLILYRKVREGWQISKGSYWAILLLSFFFGWSHESFSIGIAGALVLYYILNYKNLERREVGLMLAFCLGTAMIVFSPGTLGRFNERGVTMSFLEFFYSRIGGLFFMKRFALFVICFLALVSFKQLNLKYFYRTNIFLIYILSISVLFILMLGFVNERSLFGVDFFSFVLFICMLNQLSVTKSLYWKYTVMLLFCIFIYVIVNVIIALAVVNKEFSSIIKNYLADKNGITYMENIDIPPYYYKYINRLYPDSWEVKALSAYYGKTMHLFPFFYKEYLSNPDLYILLGNRVEGNAGLYEIPGTGIFVAQVDPDDKDCYYRYKFEYLPSTVEYKYSFRQIWHRRFYENLYDEFEKNVHPFEIGNKYIIFIDNSVYKERKLKSVCFKKECGGVIL